MAEAPKTGSNKIRKEKRVTSFLSQPKIIPIAIVEERERPGKIAIHCASPIQWIIFLFFVCNFLLFLDWA